jgi:hypothetical protein
MLCDHFRGVRVCARLSVCLLVGYELWVVGLGQVRWRVRWLVDSRWELFWVKFLTELMGDEPLDIVSSTRNRIYVENRVVYYATGTKIYLSPS